MSYVLAAPEIMTSAATDLATIGSSLGAAHTAAATRTLAVIPAAADEVSAGIAHLFSSCAQDYHAMAGQAAAFHQQLVQNLTAGAGSYAGTEAAGAALLHPLNAIAGSVASATPAAGPANPLANLIDDIVFPIIEILEPHPLLLDIFIPFLWPPLILAGLLQGMSEIE